MIFHAVYSEGSVFTATKCVFSSHFNNNGEENLNRVRTDTIVEGSNSLLVEPKEETPPSHCCSPERKEEKESFDRDGFPHLKILEPSSMTITPSKGPAPVPHQAESADANVLPLLKIEATMLEGANASKNLWLPNKEPQTIHRMPRSYSDSCLLSSQRKRGSVSKSVPPRLALDSIAEQAGGGDDDEANLYSHEERFHPGESENSELPPEVPQEVGVCDHYSGVHPGAQICTPAGELVSRDDATLCTSILFCCCCHTVSM